MKSIKAACRGWAETMAAYRLLNHIRLTPSKILECHREALVIRAQAHPCVSVIQDTTELDFSTKKCLEGSGPLNSEKRRGFFAHTQFVITEDRLPLGVLNTHLYARTDEDFRQKRKSKPIEDKESYRWLKAYQETCHFAEQLPDTEVFSISDREGDIFEVYDHWDQLQKEPTPPAHWIIRANQDRSLIIDDEIENGESDAVGAAPQITKLFAQAAVGKELGIVEFDIKSKEQWKKVKGNRVHTVRSNRTVRQRVKACQVTVKPPYRKGVKLALVSFWVILAEEIDPPAGEEPIQWIILTSKPIYTFKEAGRILKLYLSRWEIEVFHRVLKTGCKVEEIQLKDDQAVFNRIVLCMIVAWRILYLTHLGRTCPDLPCSVVFDEAEWKSALAVHNYQKKKKERKQKPAPETKVTVAPETVTSAPETVASAPETVGSTPETVGSTPETVGSTPETVGSAPKTPPEPSLGEMIRIIAEFGGHLGRKNDGPPGAQAIWQGLTRVRDFALAWEMIHS